MRAPGAPRDGVRCEPAAAAAAVAGAVEADLFIRARKRDGNSPPEVVLDAALARSFADWKASSARAH